MPTQTIIATVRGTSKATLQRIVSPRYVMAGVVGRTRIGALVNAEYLPGATIVGDGEVALDHLALGAVLAVEGGVTIGGSGRLFGVYEWSASGGITFDGSSNFQIGLYDWSAAGGVTIGGDAEISTGVSFATQEAA